MDLLHIVDPNLKNFVKCVERTLKWEGGFVDNPNDPGGRTNKGITQKEYDRYRQEKAEATQDVKDISDDEVVEIYYNNYYLQVHSELFEADIKVQWKVFDIGVNMGVSRAMRFVQTIIGTVPDGQFGPNSQMKLAAYKLNSNWSSLMMQSLVNLQTQKYKDLATNNPKLQVFLKGWLRRAADIGDGLV